MKQTILLLFLFMVGLMPAKADNITVDGTTSASYLLSWLQSGCRLDAEQRVQE